MEPVDSRPINPGAPLSVKSNFPVDEALHPGSKNPDPAAELKSVQKNLLPQTPSFLQAGEALKAAALVLGLPQDTLSLTLLAFSRLFSIPQDSALLSGLRKELLSGGSSSPKTDKEKTILESKTLAALAAADKGVTLDRNDLETYAIMPWDSDFTEQNREKKQFFKSMNRIPGKNGRRWIVWPFNFDSGGTELKVLVRILIKEPFSSMDNNCCEGCISADIAGPKHTWCFLLNKSRESLTCDVGIIPALSSGELKNLRKNLKKDLGLSNLCINNGKTLHWADELISEVLPTVNEEV